MPEDVSSSNSKAKNWPSLSIVVPCYNELDRLEALHKALKSFNEHWSGQIQIILVDDGSLDLSFRKMQALFSEMNPAQIVILHYPDNRGKGYALQFGIKEAQCDYVLTMDADVATSPMMVFKWFEDPAQIEPSTIYIGSREHLNSRIRVPGIRKWSGRLFNLFTRISSGIPYLDTQCGFKWYPRAYARQLFANLITFGWAHDIEILWKARKAHWKIQEMPVDWDHQSNSKIRLLSDGLAMGWEVLQMRIYFWKRSLFKSKIHEKRN
ncbi:MAG TPA: glycosyltransferase [Saprospiraceae bacterium]|nr:glycosyltransferase [Saprospiraceae bacterium]MCB9268620.1 glycosyltransferase [Lewinellaceae bacterium]HPG05792.1 glycosyltransferase [Saprospiraceae bacterium]HPR00950.1 glycosyltransferase [Saprospiraceae bacterium]HQU54760.1 glycosyltransferase [Saprospiraceae bacterium]